MPVGSGGSGVGSQNFTVACPSADRTITNVRGNAYVFRATLNPATPADGQATTLHVQDAGASEVFWAYGGGTTKIEAGFDFAQFTVTGNGPAAATFQAADRADTGASGNRAWMLISTMNCTLTSLTNTGPVITGWGAGIAR